MSASIKKIAQSENVQMKRHCEGGGTVPKRKTKPTTAKRELDMRLQVSCISEDSG